MRNTTFTVLLFGLSSLLAAQSFTVLTPAEMDRIKAPLSAEKGIEATQNALADHAIRELTVDRALGNGQQHLFSDIIDVSGITNQKSSGRCWLFAGLNILRPDVIDRYKLEEFEFSHNYLFFYDKLEKANLFLNYMIEWRERDLEDRELQFLLDHPIGDGGQWNMVVDLVEKYGLVPMSAMPETYASSNTGDLNRLLQRKLRQSAARIRSAHSQGADLTALLDIRTAALQDVYRLLVLTLGTPPESFTWRYETTKGKVSDPVRYTPQEFRDELVREPLSEYVYLLHDPNKTYWQTYAISLDRDLVETSDMRVVNIPLDALKAQTLSTVSAGTPVWFACDVGKDQWTNEGLMVRGIYAYEELLGVNVDLTKAEQLLYGDSVPTHAMVFVGVDREKGKARQWRVENSWGTDRGKDGYWLMDDAWFDQNLYGVILPRRVLDSATLKAAETDPVVVPPWDPMYALIIGPQ
jgi:bleomycin hydrolase